MGNLKATNENIIRAIRDLNPNTRIPDPLKTSIENVYDDILNIDVVRNEFVSALIGRIALTQINSSYFRNPLSMLKSDPMRYGLTEQEIFVNLIKGKAFDQFAGVSELYAFYDSNVMAAYHKVNPAIQYPITITYDNLRMAFTSETGVRDLITAKVNALYSSAEYDEFITMKMLAETAFEKGQLFNVKCDVTTVDGVKDLTKSMKSYIGQMKFPHPEYNIAGATSTAMENGIYYMVTPEIDASLDVDVLATAFHDSKVDISAHKIVVDKFNNPHIKALLFDMRWFKVRENFRTMSDSRNGAALTWNYFYTLSQMYSYSPFFTMIAFTDEDMASDVTITVTDTTASKSSTVAITAVASSASGTGYLPQVFDYEVSGNTSEFTKFIPGSNILSIGNDEKSETLTVTVKERTGSASGTGTVTIK